MRSLPKPKKLKYYSLAYRRRVEALGDAVRLVTSIAAAPKEHFSDNHLALQLHHAQTQISVLLGWLQKKDCA